MNVQRITNRSAIREGLELWNELHPSLAYPTRLATQNVYTLPPGVRAACWGAYDDDALVGFAVGKHLTRPVRGYDEPTVGWLSLLAVDGTVADQRRVGECLAGIALDFMVERGIETVTVGGDVQKFVPGLPASLKPNYGAALEAVGFEARTEVWDLHCDISTTEVEEAITDYADPEGVTARPAAPDDEDALFAFLDAEFSGRWAFQVETIRRVPGGIDDYWLLWHDGEVVGFARTGTADSTVLSSCVNWGAQWGDRYCGLGPSASPRTTAATGGGWPSSRRSRRRFGTRATGT